MTTAVGSSFSQFTQKYSLVHIKLQTLPEHLWDPHWLFLNEHFTSSRTALGAGVKLL